MKNNWNTESDRQILKRLKDAFFLDLKKVSISTLKNMIKNETKKLTRKNGSFSKQQITQLEKYIKTKKPTSSLFAFRSLLLKYVVLPKYTAERNKIVMFYTNYAARHCKHNVDLYGNLLIGVIEGIDYYDPKKSGKIANSVCLYCKKNANQDIEYDTSYPYRLKATDFLKIKREGIKVYKSVAFRDELDND